MRADVDPGQAAHLTAYFVGLLSRLINGLRAQKQCASRRTLKAVSCGGRIAARSLRAGAGGGIPMQRLILIPVVLLHLAACGGAPPDAGDENAMDMTNAIATDPEGPERPRVLCPEIGERVTEDECEDVKALKADVRPGAAALDVPNPMTRGRSGQVTLVIDRRPLREIRQLDAGGGDAPVPADGPATDPEPDTNVVNATGEDPGALRPRPAPDEGDSAPTPEQAIDELPGQDYGFSSSVGRYMRASLAGQGFDIRLISPEDPVQEIAAGGQASWIWEVTPRAGGQRSLTVRTEALAKVKDRMISLSNAQTSKTVVVEIRPIDSVKDFLIALPDWLKLISGVLVAATALAVAWFQFHKSLAGRQTK